MSKVSHTAGQLVSYLYAMLTLQEHLASELEAEDNEH